MKVEAEHRWELGPPTSSTPEGRLFPEVGRLIFFAEGSNFSGGLEGGWAQIFPEGSYVFAEGGGPEGSNFSGGPEVGGLKFFPEDGG